MPPSTGYYNMNKMAAPPGQLPPGTVPPYNTSPVPGMAPQVRYDVLSYSNITQNQNYPSANFTMPDNPLVSQVASYYDKSNMVSKQDNIKCSDMHLYYISNIKIASIIISSL